MVVNRESGEQLEATRSKGNTAEAPERWVIRDGEKRPIYFERKDVETCELRKRLEEIPKERRDIRNNGEATIFQIGLSLPRGQESVSRARETPDVGGEPEYMGKLQTDTGMEYTESERNDGVCHKKWK